MKNEPVKRRDKKQNKWIVDESKCLSKEEVMKLRKICEKMKEEGIKKKRFPLIRNWFMVELGLNAGLRVEEMASLRCQDLIIEKTKSSILVIGKGNKKRAVWISSRFKKICKEYLKYKRDFNYGTKPEDYLLNNLKNRKISKRALQKFFKQILEKAGLSEHYYIHCLRHTYTTFLLKASNYNYRFVQQQLGHASIRTTQTYANVVETEGRKALERLYR